MTGRLDDNDGRGYAIKIIGGDGPAVTNRDNHSMGINCHVTHV